MKVPIEVKIGRLKLRMPPMGTPENTLRIAAAVNQRMEELQEITGDPDTYDLAIMAAMAFAEEAEEAQKKLAIERKATKEKQQEEEQELLQAFKRIGESLHSLLDDIQQKRGTS